MTARAAPWARLSESAPDGVDRWITVTPPHGWQPRGPRDTQNAGRHATGAVSGRSDRQARASAFPDLPTHRHVAPEPEPSGRGPKVHDDATTSRDTEAIAWPTRSFRNFPTPGSQLSGKCAGCGSGRTSPAHPPAPNSGGRLDGAGRALAAALCCRSGAR